MKQIITTLAVLLLIASSFAQTTDTIKFQYKINNDWVNSGLFFITYDANCKIIYTESGTWDQSQSKWNIFHRSNFTYKSSGQLSQVLSEQWDEATQRWRNSTINTYVYSPDGLSHKQIFQTWDNTNNTWVNSSKIIISNDASSNPVYFQLALYVNNAWLNIYRNISQYDEDMRIKNYQEQFWQNNKWQSNYKIDYRYNSTETQETIHIFFYDTLTKQWFPHSRTEEYLLPGTLSVVKSQTQKYDAKWINYEREQNIYNSNNLIVKGFSKILNVNNNTWEDSYRVKYEYYEDSMIKSFTYETWNPSSNLWDGGSRTFFTHNGCPLSASLQSADDKTEYGISYNELRKLGEQKNISVQQLMRSLYSNGRDFSIPLENSLQNKQAENYLLNIKIIPSNQIAQQQQAKDVSNISVQQNTISIVPNPAKSYVIIRSSQMINNGSFKLYDMQGKLLFISRLENVKEQKINLPSLSKGVYNASLINGNETENKLLYIE